MTQKQYADMTTIMMFGRIFAEQMKTCLVNSGLWDKGFCLAVDTHPVITQHGETSGSVRIFKSYSDENADHSDDMYQMYWEKRWDEGKGWMVVHDPIAETGSLPPEVHIKERRDFAERVGKYSSKPYPMDGLWISSHDDPPVLGGGR